MNQDSKHDDVLMNILKDELHIIPFLDTIFGFLFRRTDFYIVSDNPNAKVGFPPGCAEQVVRDTFRKWQKEANVSTQGSRLSPIEDGFANLVVHEEEVETTEDTSETYQEEDVHQNGLVEIDRDDLSSDTFNGADRGHYRWSQTALEIDIKIPIPSYVTSAKSVKVEVQSNVLSASVQDSECQWTTLVEGDLSYKHHRDESIWTFFPGKLINVHLQKAEERWWDRLLLSEPKLDMNKMDMSRHATELPDEDKMQVEKALIQEERKRLGLPPVGHEEKLEMFEKAWNQEGSPFQGTPFDPSVLHIPPQ